MAHRTAGNEAPAEAIGRAIRSAIVAAGLTIEVVADKVEIPLSTFSRRVNGKNGSSFTFPELLKIAAAVDQPLSQLIAAAERIVERERAEQESLA